MEKSEKKFLLILLLIIGPLILIVALLVGFFLGYLFGVALSVLGCVLLLMTRSIKLKTIKSFFLNPFNLLIIIGLAISMFMYVSTIWLENYVCNPKTQDVAAWIYGHASFIFVFNDNPVFLDALLFSGIILASIGTFLLYRERAGNAYAVGKTLFIYSVFIAVMIFITVDVTKWLSTTFWGVNVASNGFPSWNYGFPTWTYQVTTITAFFKYPDYTLDNPNVYFLNYWQLFTICISIALVSWFWLRDKAQD